MTVLQLIERSLRRLGVLDNGEDPTSDEVSDGIDVLNDLLYSIASQRWGVHTISLLNHTLTSGTDEYSIGSAGTIAETRPVRILSAFLRRDDVDYPVNIRSREYMDARFDKTVTGVVRDLYYEPTYPTGTVTLYPIPDNSSDVIYFRAWQPIATYSASGTTIDLPPEYHSWLIWNLARDYASEFGVAIPENVAVRSMETTKVLKNLHAVPVPQMNTNPMGISGSTYDITTDEYYT